MKFSILGNGPIGIALTNYLVRKGHNVARCNRLRDPPYPHIFYCLGNDDNTDPFGMLNAHAVRLSEVLEGGFERLVYLSTTRVYLKDDNPFAIMKLAGEALCAVHPYATVVRLSTVLGGEPVGSSLIPRLIRSAQEGEIHLHLSPYSSRDYIAMDDVCEMLLKIMMGGYHTTYNLASGHNFPIDKIVQIVSEGFNAEVVWHSGPWLDHPLVDISRIQKDFGFVARDPLEALNAQIRDLSRSTYKRPRVLAAD